MRFPVLFVERWAVALRIDWRLRQFWIRLGRTKKCRENKWFEFGFRDWNKTMLKQEFYSHHSVIAIRYRVLYKDSDGFFVVADDSGNERTMHPKVLEGILKGQAK